MRQNMLLSGVATAATLLSGRVFINGAEVKKSSVTLQAGDKVSVRGYGKFRYLGETGKTKKGNLIVAVEKFV